MGAAQALRGPRISRWHAVVAILLASVGFIVVTQVRQEWLIKRTLRIPSTRLDELAFVLREQERTRAALEGQIAELRTRIQEYERAAAEGRSAVARLNRTVQEMRVLAGLTPLEGPGVVVELNDSTRPPKPGEDPNKTILHYADITAVIAELWAAGAEAMALNGERVISSTGINCVGTTILCNTKRVAPPYVISAIGDPKSLTDHLRRPGGNLELLASFDFPVKVSPRARVEVPAYRGTFRFEHTAVVGGQE